MASKKLSLFVTLLAGLLVGHFVCVHIMVTLCFTVERGSFDLMGPKDSATSLTRSALVCNVATAHPRNTYATPESMRLIEDTSAELIRER